MTVSALPFTTALMAAYLKESRASPSPPPIYSGSFLLMGVVFAGMNRHILFERVDFLGEGLDEPARRLTLKRAVAGLLPLRDRHRRRPAQPLPDHRDLRRGRCLLRHPGRQLLPTCNSLRSG